MPGLMIFSINSGYEPGKINLPLQPDSLDEISNQLPQGVYSTFRTLNSCEKALGLSMHLNRLYIPASELGVHPSIPAIELRKTLRKLLSAYQPGEARVRICLSLNETPGQLFVIIEPLKLLNEAVYSRGVRVVTCDASRTNPRLKTTSFIRKSALQRESLLKDDIFEALMKKNERILEGLTSNFYAVYGRKIITARQGILLGVTRRFVIKLARSLGFEIEYRSLLVHELAGINEAFITSSSRGVVPVIRVDGIQIGQGSPGDAARILRQAYDKYVLNKAEII